MRRIPLKARQQIDATILLLDGLTTKMRAFFDTRSDHWTEEDGAGYEEWIGEYEEACDSLISLVDTILDHEAHHPSNLDPSLLKGRNQAFERLRAARAERSKTTAQLRDEIRAEVLEELQDQYELVAKHRFAGVEKLTVTLQRMEQMGFRLVYDGQMPVAPKRPKLKVKGSEL